MARDAGALVLLDDVEHVDGVAEAGVDVGHHRQARAVDHGARHVEMLGHRHHADVGHAVHRRELEARRPDGIEARFRHQHGRQRAVRRHRLDEALLCQDLPEFRARCHGHPFNRCCSSSARKRAPASMSCLMPSCRLVADRILAPALDLIELVELGRGKRIGRRKMPLGNGQRHDQRARNVREVVERRQAEVAVRRHRRAQPRDGIGRLLDERQAFDDDEPRAVALVRPVEQRLPGRLLALHQGLGLAGAIAQHVGARVLGGVLDHAGALARDAIEPGRRQPCQRQVRDVDVGLVRHRPPFGRDRLGERARRHHQHRLGRRAHGPAVEQDAMAAVAAIDGRLFIEALHRGEGLHVRPARRQVRLNAAGCAAVRRSGPAAGRRVGACRRPTAPASAP